MPRRLVKRFTPSKQQLESNRALKAFKKILDKKHLWRIERKNVARGVAVGWIVACAPIIGQTPLAVVAAFLFRANIPVTVFMAWTTNPVTIPPLVYLSYKIGSLFIETPMPEGLGWNIESLEKLVTMGWEPILIGLGFIAGIGSVIGYYLTHYLWKIMVLSKRKRELKRRRQRAARSGGIE